MNFTSKIFGENMKRLTANIFLLFIISSFAFSFDVDVDRQKKEREIADRISSEIRRNFFDIRFLVNVEITIDDESLSADEEIPQDLMLPGVTGFQSSKSSTKENLKITLITVKILVDKSISNDDENLLKLISMHAGKLSESRGDVVDVQRMNFPDLKNKQNEQFQKDLDFIQRGYRQLDSMRSDEQRKQVDDLRKKADEMQKSLSFRDTLLASDSRRILDNLQYQLNKADSLLRVEQDKRIANLESSMEKKGIDPLVWGLVGLSTILLLILLILLFALLSKKRKEESQVQEYQQQLDPYSQQGALTAGEEGANTQTSLEETINEMNENAEYDKIRSTMIAASAGESNNISYVIKDLMKDPAQRENLLLIVNQLGGTLMQVLKDYFTMEEMKSLQDLYLEKTDKGITEKKEALQYLQSQLNIKRFAEARNTKQNPFGFLEKLSEPQLYLLIKDEPAGIIAIIISQLPSALASSLIKSLSTSQQGEVALELGKLKRMTSDAYVSVAKQLATKAATIPVINNVQMQGSDMLLDIFDNLDENTEESIIEFIKTVNLDLFKEISSQRVGFGALHLLDDKLLRQLIKDIENEEIAIALKNASEEVLEKFYSVLPTKQRTMLEDKIAGIKKVKPDEELKARRKITRMIRTYVKSGLGTLEGLQESQSTEEVINEEEIITEENIETIENTTEETNETTTEENPPEKS